MKTFTKLLTITSCFLLPFVGFSADKPVMVNATFKHYEEPWLLRAPFEPVKEGELHMFLDINEDGTVADWMITRAYHEDLVKSVNRVVEEWTFNPATMDGKPIPVVKELVFTFSKRGASLVEGNLMDIYLERLPYLHRDHIIVRNFEELDRLPEPIDIVRPVIDNNIPPAERIGNAVVSFFIDETGKVRIPVVESYEGHRGLADSAYNAILQWKFKPPTISGRPVVVRVSQPFDFKPSPDADAP